MGGSAVLAQRARERGREHLHSLLSEQPDAIRRPDDGGQLTLDGLPLYTFTEEEAGRLEGDGFVDDFRGTHFVWEAATTGARAGPPAVDSGSPY